METFNEFGEVPAYLNDKYRVNKNYGIQESGMFGATPQSTGTTMKFQMDPVLMYNIAQNMQAQQQAAQSGTLDPSTTQIGGGTSNGTSNGNGNGNGNGQKGFLASYYGGWKLFTLVPLAGILYYLRNKDESQGMRIGKAVGASAIYAPYLVYAVGKSIYDVAKK